MLDQTPRQARIAEAFQRMRRGHCARKGAAHDCVGSIVVGPRGMALDCPLCGDVYLAPNQEDADAMVEGLIDAMDAGVPPGRRAIGVVRCGAGLPAEVVIPNMVPEDEEDVDA